MKKLYEKSELAFAIVWIVVYCVLQSVANPLNKIVGPEYSISAVFCVIQTVILLVFILVRHTLILTKTLPRNRRERTNNNF